LLAEAMRVVKQLWECIVGGVGPSSNIKRMVSTKMVKLPLTIGWIGA
jgi:hypothetical protein